MPALALIPILAILVSVAAAHRGRRFFAKLELIKYAIVAPALAALIFMACHDANNDLLTLAALLVLAAFGSTAYGLCMLGQIARLRGHGPPRCSHCAYNLTGNISGTCPECGTPIRTG